MSASVSENIQSKTISDIIKKWFLNSPSNGIRRIGQAKTLIASIFWGYSFWIFTIFMSCFITIIINNYTAHPTKTHLILQNYRDPKYFPAVTFCNINPLKHDTFINDVRKGPLPGSGSSSNISEFEYLRQISAYMERILQEQLNGDQHPLVATWGFQLNDLLITCIFNRQLCNRNLTQIFHPNYGNCYTFDNKDHVQNERISNIRYDWSMHTDDGDENYKLYLELFLHQNEYNKYLDDRAAFRIFIHRKQEIPILSETSLFLGPHKYTKIQFLPRVVLLSQQCRNDSTNEMKRIFSTQKVRYTRALCYQFCEHRFIIKECQCIEPTSAVFYQFFNNNLTKTNISLCSIDDPCLKIRDYFKPSQLCPECLSECEIIQYSIQSSHALFPNTNARDKVLQRVRDHFRHDRKVNNDLQNRSSSTSSNRGSLYDNMVAVEISASPYATEILIESSVYTWIDLISSIGGQTALWIGISLISLVEIMELLYSLISHFCSYLFVCKK